MLRVLDHSAIFMTILLTVYSQLIMRWQVADAGGLPDAVGEKLLYIVELLLKPWVISAIVASFLAGVSWMLAMTRFEVSYAYPFIGLNFVLILFASVLLFGESLSVAKVVGTLLIVIGIIVVAQG